MILSPSASTWLARRMPLQYVPFVEPMSSTRILPFLAHDAAVLARDAVVDDAHVGSFAPPDHGDLRSRWCITPIALPARTIR